MERVKEWFGFGETPEQRLRRYKRTIDRAVREVDRERMKMQRVEQQRKNEIKKLAREGQLKSTRIAARDLVRVRNNVAKMYELRSQMQSVQMQLSAMRSSEAMTEAMRGIVGSMQLMNKQVNLPKINKILRDFERESEVLSMKQEVVDDAMDDAIADGDESEETEEIVNQVLDELGLEKASRLGNAPASRQARHVGEPGSRDEESMAAESAVEPNRVALGGQELEARAPPGNRPASRGSGRRNDDGSGGGMNESLVSESAPAAKEHDDLAQRLENLRK